MEIEMKRLTLIIALAGSLSGCGGGGSVPVTPPLAPQLTRAEQTVQTLKATNASLPSVMTTPPTIQTGAANAPSAIADNRMVPWTSSSLRQLGCALVQEGTTAPDNQYGISRHVNYGNNPNVPTACREDFMTDASQFEIVTQGKGGSLRVWVDGKLTQQTPIAGPPADNNQYSTLVDFNGVSTLRHIRIETTNLPFAGIRVPANAVVNANVTLNPLRIMVLGDSYTEGVGANAGFTSYVFTTGELLGIDDIWESGVGSTGYLAAPFNRVKFRDRLQSDIVAYNPDVLIVAGGINDQVLGYTDAQIQAEASNLFQAISTALPDTIVIVASPWSPHTDYIRLSLRDAIKTAAQPFKNFYFIDTEDWINGSGNVSAPMGDGNADIYISSDTIHPTQAGHDYLGQKLAAAIKTALGI